eukprot:553778_1
MTTCPRGHSTDISYMNYWASSWVDTWKCSNCKSPLPAGKGCYYYHCNGCCTRDNHRNNHVISCRGMYCVKCVEDKTREIKEIQRKRQIEEEKERERKKK